MAVNADGPSEAWDSFNRVWHGLFAFTLAVPTLLAAGFGLWYYVVLIRHPQWWGRAVPMTVY